MITCNTFSARAVYCASLLFFITILFLSAGAKAFSAAIEIIEQPKELLECEGAKNLRLVAVGILSDGSEPAYLWFKDASPIAGATSPIYPISEMTPSISGVYKCRVSNPDNPAEFVDSREVVVYALGRTSIVRQDTLVTVPFGQEAALTVEAHIKGLTVPYFQNRYQWFRRRTSAADEKIIDNEMYVGSNTPRLIIKNINSLETNGDDLTYLLEIEGQCGKVYSKLINVSTRLGVRFIGEWGYFHRGKGYLDRHANYDGCGAAVDSGYGLGNYRHWEYWSDMQLIGAYDSFTVEHLVTPPPVDTLWYRGSKFTITYEEMIFSKGLISTGWVSTPLPLRPTSKQSHTNKIRVKFYPGGEVFESPGITWTFHDVQEITKQPQSMTVDEGTDFTLSVEAKCDYPLTYQWYKDKAKLPNKTESKLDVSAASLTFDGGKYWVRIDSQCDTIYSDTAIVTIKPMGLVGASDVSISTGILSLSPNPAADEIDIKFKTANAGTANFKILEASGRELMSFSAGAGEEHIRRDISALASGAYWLVMGSGGERYIEKIMIIK